MVTLMIMMTYGDINGDIDDDLWSLMVKLMIMMTYGDIATWILWLP